MAQTLAILPAITSPVTVIQAKTFSANLAAIANLNNREVIALSVISKIYQLKAKGGTDYTGNSGYKQLQKDVTSLLGMFSLEAFLADNTQFQKMQAVLDWNAGYTATTTLGTDVNALRVLMLGLAETPSSTLNLYRLFLLYMLAV